MVRFTKMQGAGNDFVVVEASDTLHDWSQLAIAICDRHYGIGADGLLLLLPSEVADFRMRVFNADGSEADACGNGLRCLIKYFVDGGLVSSEAGKISAETVAGIRRSEVYKAAGKIAKIQIGMGEPKFSDKDIPVIIEEQGSGNVVDINPPITCSLALDGRELPLRLLSVGNPHAVYFSQHPVADFSLSRLGPQIEQYKLFPNGVNFEVARILDRGQIEARVWERGVGETLACGSGACAIAVTARLLGHIDDKVDIKLPGGILGVEWDGVGEAFLSGPAETVFTGEWTE